jgi:hypothetical protein
MKGKVQSQQQKNISYRSYKNFDVDIFNSELNQVAFPDIENIETSEQVNNAYMQYQDSFIHILNKHAPVKTRRPGKNPLPCMNSELRGAIYRNSCPKITSFGTSRAAFQKIIFHGFLFQFSNQISLLSKFLPCFSIALLGILGIQHMFAIYSPSKLTVHTGKWIFSRSSCLDRSMFV